MKLALLSIVSEETQLKRFVQKMCPPLGFYYMEEYLKEKLPEVEIFISLDVNEIIASKPDLIGVSSVTENFSIALKTIEHIKNTTDIPIILGGVHISLLPENLPEECVLASLGESEDTIVELLQVFMKYKKFEESNIKNIKGIAYRNEKGKLIITDKRPLIEPLDKIPFPKRHFVDLLGITHVISSRGCPYKCTFCSTSTFWNCFRAHSARYVADEIKHILEHVNPPHIKFFDDLFIANKNRIRELAKYIEEENLIPEHGFSCFVRAELLDREMMDLLKKMGFVGLALGIETASPDMRNKLKGSSTIDINQKALDLCYEYGFNTTCSFIIGAPGETKNDLELTCKFMVENENKITEIEVCPIVPFPGTELWDYALKRGLVSNHMDWSVLEDYSIFTQFDPSRYIYLNESMSFEDFKYYCQKFLVFYGYFSDKGRQIYLDVMRKEEK